MLERSFYFSRMNIYKNKNYIYGLVGPRESGKTTFFSQIIEYIRKNKIADEFHIIQINLEFINNEKYRDANTLQDYLESKLLDSKTYFLFFDEIQYLPFFEKFLHALTNKYTNIKIFISCSNSRLLPDELNPIIKNKIKIFFVTPFSYKEVCTMLNTNPRDKNMLSNYLFYGGFPARLHLKKISDVKRYLYSTLDSIFLRDIVMRLGMKDIEKLNTILKFMSDFLGKDFSISNLLNKFVENEQLMTRELLHDSIDALSKALIIKPAKGYNLNTKQILPRCTPRFYFTDLGFLYVYGFDVKNNMDAIFKNLVWLELIKRGYEVYTGINGDIKVDFVAIRNEKTMFIQVVYLLEDGNTANKVAEELNTFESTYPKYIFSMDKTNFSRQGIIHTNIIDFLLNDDTDIENINIPEKWVTIE